MMTFPMLRSVEALFAFNAAVVCSIVCTATLVVLNILRERHPKVTNATMVVGMMLTGFVLMIPWTIDRQNVPDLGTLPEQIRSTTEFEMVAAHLELGSPQQTLGVSVTRPDQTTSRCQLRLTPDYDARRYTGTLHC